MNETRTVGVVPQVPEDLVEGWASLLQDFVIQQLKCLTEQTPSQVPLEIRGGGINKRTFRSFASKALTLYVSTAVSAKHASGHGPCIDMDIPDREADWIVAFLLRYRSANDLTAWDLEG